jgi:GNAT superfamily N-acetyltransferase
MSPDRVSSRPSFWRPMVEADLDGVLSVAGIVHPTYPERRAVVAQKRALCPEGSLVLPGEGGEVLGYAIGHPWKRLCPGPLDTVLDALPEPPETFWIHDVALLPVARGRGEASAAVAALLAEARRRGLATASLVSVHESQRFWAGHGFAPVPLLPAKALARVLDVYGNAAVFMEARLDVSAGRA